MTSWRGWKCWPSFYCCWNCMLTKCDQQIWSVNQTSINYR